MKTVGIIWIIVVLAIIVGWIKNIFDIVDLGFDSGVTIEIALRIAGIFIAPLGAIMGYAF